MLHRQRCLVNGFVFVISFLATKIEFYFKKLLMVNVFLLIYPVIPLYLAMMSCLCCTINRTC